MRNCQLQLCHSNARLRAAGVAAFSRVDLVVTISLILLLGAFFCIGRTGERARIARCTSNLEELGRAMHAYANDHEGALPAAVVNLDTNVLTWDTQLFPYVSPAMRRTSDVFKEKQHVMALARSFVCPSDYFQHNSTPRSYAMPEHNMVLSDWPPNGDSSSGVGLYWDNRSVEAILSESQAAQATNEIKLLPAVKFSEIPKASDTMLLTEYVDRNNLLQSSGFARVANVAQQRAAFKGDSSCFHFGKFNYLMIDGHVELLTGAQTGSENSQAGIWTINPLDGSWLNF